MCIITWQPFLFESRNQREKVSGDFNQFQSSWYLDMSIRHEESWNNLEQSNLVSTWLWEHIQGNFIEWYLAALAPFTGTTKAWLEPARNIVTWKCLKIGGLRPKPPPRQRRVLIKRHPLDKVLLIPTQFWSRQYFNAARQAGGAFALYEEAFSLKYLQKWKACSCPN